MPQLRKKKIASDSKVMNWVAGGLALATAGILLDALFLEKYFFELKTFKIGNLAGRKSVRLILLSDLHLKTRLWPYHYRLARTLNRLMPDLLLLAGDTLDSRGTIKPLERFLQLLEPDIKKVAVPGNHDYVSGVTIAELAEAFRQHNGQLLINNSATFSIRGEQIVITGLNDFIQSEGNLEVALHGLNYEEHHLLLLHSPLQQENVLRQLDQFNISRKKEKQFNIQYIFAGHNHGGQVRLPGIIPVLPYKSGNYLEGWYNKEKPLLYLSRGFGTSRLPFRFFARSEVTVFEYFI